jgi:hypothetical protein
MRGLLSSKPLGGMLLHVQDTGVSHSMRHGKPRGIVLCVLRALILSQLPHAPSPTTLTYIIKDLQGGLQGELCVGSDA